MKNLYVFLFVLVVSFLNIRIQAQEFIESIPNPLNYTNSNTGYFNSGSSFEFNNQMFLRFRNDDGTYKLYSYDGSSLNLIPNPPNHNIALGYIGQAILYDVKVALRFRNNNSVDQLVLFDGNSFDVIPNPPNHTNPARGYQGNPFEYNGELFLYYWNNNGVRQLYKFDGTSLSLIPNPGRDYRGDPFEYNGELYFRYINNSNNVLQLYKYDGSSLSLIPNPPNHTNAATGYYGIPFKYNGELFLRYRNNSSVWHLYKYDGTSLSLIPNPPNHSGSSRGYEGNPFEYNGNLYLRYRNNNNLFQLYKYEANSLTLISNPPNHTIGNAGYRGRPYLFDGEMYLQFWNNNQLFQLYKFNGNSLSLVSNPPNHTNAGRGYSGTSVIDFNDKLYLDYRNNNGNYKIYSYDGASLSLVTDSFNNTGANSRYREPFNFNEEIYYGYNNDNFIYVLTRLRDTNTWQGTVNNDWQNTSNWSKSVVPNDKDLVVVSDVVNEPNIGNNSTVELRDLTLETSSQLNNYGTLKINNQLTNNGQITFKSDATSTGQFDEFTGTYSGSGMVEIERFIPAGDNQKRAFRFLTSSVTTPTSIRANWQEGVNNTSTGLSNNLNPSPGFGTHISGSLTGENGFDATLSGNPSLFLFNNLNQTWNAISNTDASILETGKAYRLFIRGDRSIDLTSNASTPTNTTLRAKGELSFGPVDMTSELAQNAEEFSFLGNPYQSIVNFGALNFGGGIKTNFLYIWNPNLATRGAYETIDLSTSPSQAMLQPGQSFFVQNSTTITTPPTLEFTEASKFTEGNVSEVFSEEETAKANLLLLNVQNEKQDEVKLRLQRGANNDVDDFDAGKLSNETENLALLNGNKFLAVERRDLPSSEELLPLFINQYQNTDYQFSLHLEEWDLNIKVFILDNYLNTETLLAPDMPYSFSIDASISESLAEDRFILKLRNTTLGGLDQPNINNFLLYPNPTQDGQFSIQTNFEAGTQVDVKIFNVMGQEVMNLRSRVNPSQDLNINANQLSNGVYIVDIVHEKQSYSAKLVID